jgi:hypothetical protein
VAGATTEVKVDRDYKGLFERSMDAIINAGTTFDTVSEEGQKLAAIVKRHTGEDGKFDSSIIWESDELITWGKYLTEHTLGENGTSIQVDGINIEYGGTDFNRSSLSEYIQRIEDGYQYEFTEVVSDLDNLISTNSDYFGGKKTAREYFGWEEGYMPTTADINLAFDKIAGVIDSLTSTKNSLIQLAGRSFAQESLYNTMQGRGDLSSSLIGEIGSNNIYSSIMYQAL